MSPVRPISQSPIKMTRGKTKLTRLKFISVIIVVLIIYNEWISFTLKSYSWPKLLNDSEEDFKILIVADPQILSVVTEPNFPFNYVTVWDSNRFVSRTFHLSLSFGQPDIVVFLGDLINDGSLSTDEEFVELVATFKNLLYIPPSVKHVLYIPGDNDIGGEGYDKVSMNKIRRFNKAFNVTSPIHYKFVSLYHLNIIPGTSQETPNVKSTYVSNNPETTIRILFSHLPLIPGVQKSVIDRIHDISPSLIFSAHDHDSYKFVGKKSNPKADQFWLLRDDDKIWHMNLKGEELHEISVPTCSYRMGKDKYGYGFGVITRDGLFKYTVLWLPSRFNHLWCYFWGLCLCISMLVYPFIYHINEKLSRLKTPSPIQKYHRV